MPRNLAEEMQLSLQSGEANNFVPKTTIKRANMLKPELWISFSADYLLLMPFGVHYVTNQVKVTDDTSLVIATDAWVNLFAGDS